MKPIAFTRLSFALVLILGLVGCGTNPVTGKKELSFYSTAAQIQLGEQNYQPAQQSQGGAYYLDPELNRYIAEVGQKLAAASDVPELPYQFVVLNNDVPNAWAMPGGKIAINRGLLVELNDESELAAVLGHEVVHAAAGHSAAQMTRGTLFGLGALAVGVATRDSKYGTLANYGAQIGSAAWMARYGRGAELDSDKYGMVYMSRAGYDPTGAVELQKTFVRMSEGRRQDFISGLFASHPPSQQRVDANQAYLAEFPSGGTRGRDRFQKAIAQLKRDAPAYEAQNEAAAALKNKDPDRALTLLDKAVALQPNEGQFWEMRGHAWKDKNNDDNADKAYSTAIRKNPDYYQHWLVRGILRKEIGRNRDAETDLKRSQELLPSATASYYLGELAESRGDTQAALGYYQQAASANGEVGDAAKAKLIRHELPRNPGKYIASGILLSDRGEIFAAVRNDSGVVVSGVQVRLVDRHSGLGKDLYVRGQLSPRQQGSVGSGIVGEPANYRVDVIAARVH